MFSNLPGQVHQGYGLPRYARCDRHPTVCCIDPLGRRKKLQLACGLQVGVLTRSGMLRRTHREPRGVGIAMSLIDPVVLQQYPVRARRIPVIVTVAVAGSAAPSTS